MFVAGVGLIPTTSAKISAPPGMMIFALPVEFSSALRDLTVYCPTPFRRCCFQLRNPSRRCPELPRFWFDYSFTLPIHEMNLNCAVLLDSSRLYFQSEIMSMTQFTLVVTHGRYRLPTEGGADRGMPLQLRYRPRKRPTCSIN